jgi:hypothetical protein
MDDSRKHCWWNAPEGLTRACAALSICAAIALPVVSQVRAAASIDTGDATVCLPDGSGYLRAKLQGSIEAELDWGNADMDCTGGSRPDDGGLRVVFSRRGDGDGGSLTLLFGIGGLREGDSAQGLPVNVTIIREGTGEFYGTQGDDRCFVDDVIQEPLAGIPRRKRAYKIVARGYCMQPARAVRGSGSILISRFDYAGRIDLGEADPEPAPESTVVAKSRHAN